MTDFVKASGNLGFKSTGPPVGLHPGVGCAQRLELRGSELNLNSPYVFPEHPKEQSCLRMCGSSVSGAAPWVPDYRFPHGEGGEGRMTSCLGCPPSSQRQTQPAWNAPLWNLPKQQAK